MERDYEFAVTELDSGLWCPKCKAPNAIGVTVAVVHAPTLVSVRTYPTVWCFTCDQLIEQEAE